MKKKIIISILIIIVLALVGIGIYFGIGIYSYHKTGEDDVIKIDVDPIPKETEEVIDEDITKDNKDNNETTENNDDSNASNATNSESNKKSSIKNNSNKSVTNNKKSNSSTKKDTNTNSSTTSTTTQTKEQTAWEKLGISEYDYYNKSMWSWCKIDFSVKTYGTYEATRNACMEHGYSVLEQNGGGQFDCQDCNSYSGDYLGEYFEYTE